MRLGPSSATTKDAHEVELILAAAELVEAGQRAVRERVEPGVTELELWEAASTAMSALRPGPTEALVDLMVGEGTSEIGRPPGPAAAAPGDPVLFDLAPFSDGYWADSCATFSCGTPSHALRRRHDAVRKALECGLGSIRPGVRACEVDAVMRAALAEAGLECPHHTGHGVGTVPQEPPWLVPDDETVLTERMVIALEPGAYSGGIGVRLEHLVFLRPDGPELLTTHSLDVT
jgi:Xaa-Pro dipeptidase